MSRTRLGKRSNDFEERERYRDKSLGSKVRRLAVLERRPGRKEESEESGTVLSKDEVAYGRVLWRAFHRYPPLISPNHRAASSAKLYISRVTPRFVKSHPHVALHLCPRLLPGFNFSLPSTFPLRKLALQRRPTVFFARPLGCKRRGGVWLEFSRILPTTTATTFHRETKFRDL